ncbi:hypothetical protein MLD38_004803 [Melastoma candidum]|uniref:Uncharacterized protein n=1 Tax=Melastoma candidum TaxID=119954 RepID=A0ACB9SBS6_9MYRT|nr:hypothetical protein MLD38_004803 [Melastoma candidum]
MPYVAGGNLERIHPRGRDPAEEPSGLNSPRFSQSIEFFPSNQVLTTAHVPAVLRSLSSSSTSCCHLPENFGILQEFGHHSLYSDGWLSSPFLPQSSAADLQNHPYPKKIQSTVEEGNSSIIFHSSSRARFQHSILILGLKQAS